MPIYEFTDNEIREIEPTTFTQMQIDERRDLQRLLRKHIHVIAPDTLVIAEEFNEWDGSRRQIDLLGIDRNANIVVIELKKNEDGGFMELQAIRYASMVSTLTFEKSVDVFSRYLEKIDKPEVDARAELLDFLGWTEPDEESFAQDVRIVLASADFGRELTTSVLWLIERDIDIRCVRMSPHNLEGRLFVDVQQIIPLPELEEYQIRVSEKKRKEREARSNSRDRTKYDLSVGGQQMTALSKRQALYQVFCHLVGHDIAPEDIARYCGTRANRAFISVDGEVSVDEFIRLVSETMQNQGREFDQSRFFCKQDELVRHSGRTYAFSSQWGDPVWLQVMQSLQNAFPDQEIEFSPSE